MGLARFLVSDAARSAFEQANYPTSPRSYGGRSPRVFERRVRGTTYNSAQSPLAIEHYTPPLASRKHAGSSFASTSISASVV